MLWDVLADWRDHLTSPDPWVRARALRSLLLAVLALVVALAVVWVGYVVPARCAASCGAYAPDVRGGVCYCDPFVTRSP